jgi:hypothetical protein
MGELTKFQPMWARKRAEGKMFQRLTCDSCRAVFHFGDSPRVSRTPRCPACGNLGGHQAAA